MTDPTANDYYARLGVETGVSERELRRAARKQQKRHHPDLNPDADASTHFKRVMDAYECLSDAEERSAYDAFRRRFGHEEAAEVYESWLRFGRAGTPESYTPPNAGVRESDTRGEKSGAAATETKGGPSDASRSDRRSDRTRSSGNSGYERSSRNSRRESEHRTHSNFGHRQSYERATYIPPSGISLRRWLATEARLLGAELSAVIAGLLAVGVGFVVAALLSFVLVVLIYPVGIAVAVVEYGLRSVGIARFDAFLVAEIGLTWALETIVYLGAIGVASGLFVMLCTPDWEAHLGNRIRSPELVLVFPTIGLITSGISPLGIASELPVALPSLLSSQELLTVLAVASWVLLHRAARLAREAPPNDGRESIVDTVAAAAWIVGTAILLLAAFLTLSSHLVEPLSEALEYTYLIGKMTPPFLVAVANGLAIAAAIAALAWRASSASAFGRIMRN